MPRDNYYDLITFVTFLKIYFFFSFLFVLINVFLLNYLRNHCVYLKNIIKCLKKFLIMGFLSAFNLLLSQSTIHAISMQKGKYAKVKKNPIVNYI